MQAETIVQIVGDQTPGPSPVDHVSESTFGQVPKIAMHTKPKLIRDSYDPYLVKIKSTIGSGRKCSMSPRYKVPPPYITPGPSYVPPPFYKNSPRFSIPKSKREKKITITPGPADYGKISDFQKEGHGIGIPNSKRKPFWETNNGPGPAYNTNSNFNAVMPRSPRVHIMSKYYKKEEPYSSRLMGPISTFSKNGYCFSRGGRTNIIQH